MARIRIMVVGEGEREWEIKNCVWRWFLGGREREGEEEAATAKNLHFVIWKKREKARDAVMLDVEKSGKRGLL
jgi:hypothetical protein